VNIRARGKSLLRRFAGDDEGLAITEYAMLVAFAALVLIAVVSIFGSQISSWLTARTGTVTTV
jgi:Flp pilus assembly pilin Flp